MKWQDINKKVMNTIAGIGAFGVILMIMLLARVDVSYTNYPDCNNGTDCYARFEMNTSYWEVCFNIDDSVIIPQFFKKRSRSRTIWVNTSRHGFVTTDPNIQTELMFGTYKSRSITQAPDGKWLREVKTGDCIKRGKVNYLYVRGKKKPNQEIKWSADLFEIDPIWFGINNNKINSMMTIQSAGSILHVVKQDGAESNYEVKISDPKAKNPEIQIFSSDSKITNIDLESKNGSLLSKLSKEQIGDKEGFKFTATEEYYKIGDSTLIIVNESLNKLVWNTSTAYGEHILKKWIAGGWVWSPSDIWVDENTTAYGANDTVATNITRYQYYINFTTPIYLRDGYCRFRDGARRVYNPWYFETPERRFNFEYGDKGICKKVYNASGNLTFNPNCTFNLSYINYTILNTTKQYSVLKVEFDRGIDSDFGYVYIDPLNEQTYSSSSSGTGNGSISDEFGLHKLALRASYSFDKEQADYITLDYSPNNNLGTVFGGAIYNSTADPSGNGNGGAYKLDGIDDYIDIDKVANFERDESFTIAMILQRDSDNTVDTFIGNREQSGAFQGIIGFIDTGTNRVSIQLNSASGGNRLIKTTSDTITADGLSHCIAFTYDGSSTVAGLIPHIDGIPANIQSTTDTLTASIVSSEKTNIGADGTGTFPFNGTIDEVKIYNEVLSPENILALCNGTVNGSKLSKTYNTWSTPFYLDEIHANLTDKVNWTVEIGAADSSTKPTNLSDPNMVLYMDNNEYLDRGLYGNNGTCSGSACPKNCTSLGGDAIGCFDGIDGQIDLGSDSSLQPVKEITVSAWIKPATLQPIAITGIVTSPRQTQSSSWLFVMGSATRLDFFVQADLGIPAASGTITVNEWNHVVGVYDGTNIIVYINGEAGTPIPQTGNITYGGNAIGSAIGQFNVNRFFNGTIDEVKIFNVTKTLEEIFEIMKQDLVHNDRKNNSLFTNGTFETYDDYNTSDPNLVFGMIFNNDNSTHFEDIVNGNNGTCTNCPVNNQSNGIIDTGVGFNGVDDSINISDNSIFDFGTNDFAISAWVKRESIGANHIIVGKDATGQRQFDFMFDASDKLVILYLRSEGSFNRFTSTATYTDNKWYHVLGQRNGNSLEIYVNSINISGTSDGTLGGTVDPTDSNLLIGARALVGSEDNFDGPIDEPFIWNRSLSSEEIRAVYQRGLLNRTCTEQLILYDGMPVNSTCSDHYAKLVSLDPMSNSSREGPSIFNSSVKGVVTAPSPPAGVCDCDFPNDYNIDMEINMSCFCNTTETSWCRNLTYVDSGEWRVNATVNYSNRESPGTGQIITWLSNFLGSIRG